MNLVAIGYKYNTKKVLHFVTTLESGRTEKGTPYKEKYNDRFGNVCYQDVPHPVVILTNFLYINAVDVNNQLRQSHLALEEFLVTTNGWFQLFTTIMGMMVTDAWFLREHCKNSKKVGDMEKSMARIKRRLLSLQGI